MTDPSAEPAPESPLFRVVSGHPTDDELAAVVAVLQARGAATPAGSGQDRAAETSGWSAYWRAVRAPVPPGPGAWRASARN